MSSEQNAEIIWLKDIGLGINNLATGVVVSYGIYLFVKHRNYILKKIPLTAFYILSITACLSSIAYSIIACWLSS